VSIRRAATSLVYRGEMVSPRSTRERVLSIWHANYLIDAARAKQRQHFYKRGLEIADVRRVAFPALELRRAEEYGGPQRSVGSYGAEPSDNSVKFRITRSYRGRLGRGLAALWRFIRTAAFG
jgi:hypothetical protein